VKLSQTVLGGVLNGAFLRPTQTSKLPKAKSLIAAAIYGIYAN